MLVAQGRRPLSAEWKGSVKGDCACMGALMLATGSWANFCRVAGVEPPKRGGHRPNAFRPKAAPQDIRPRADCDCGMPACTTVQFALVGPGGEDITGRLALCQLCYAEWQECER